jgi:hypothetical protein
MPAPRVSATLPYEACMAVGATEGNLADPASLADGEDVL